MPDGGSCVKFPPLYADAGAGPEMTAGTECSEVAHAAEFSLVARRNNSLSSTGRFLVFAFIFIVAVGIAVTFAALGAWLQRPLPER